MFRFIRHLITLALLVVGIYAGCTYDLGGKTFLGHVMDVWRSDVVQEKMAKLKHGMRGEVDQQVAKMRNKAQKKLSAEYTAKEKQLIDDVIAENLGAQ